MKYLFACAISVALIAGNAAVAGGASAAAHDKQITVSYRDLDIRQESGAIELVRRLRHAAETVCGPEPYAATDLQMWLLYQSCTKTAISHAVVTINSPELTAVYSGGRISERLAQQ